MDEKLKVVITTPDGVGVIATVYAGYGIEYVAKNRLGSVHGVHLEPNGSAEGAMSSLVKWLKSHEEDLR